jgi:hypothetical protein
VAQLSEVTDPNYLDGVEDWPLATVRTRRDELNEIETGLSYLRRIVQGRLDIVVAAENHRKQGGGGVEASDLLLELPSILGGHVHAPGLGRFPGKIDQALVLDPGQLDPVIEAQLEEILPAARLSSLGDSSVEELTECARALADLERTISGQRRAMFDVLDRLQAEIVRRYRTGEATVDSLLS